MCSTRVRWATQWERTAQLSCEGGNADHGERVKQLNTKRVAMQQGVNWGNQRMKEF